MYTISFLGVMVLFGVGNILLKVKRAGLPRPSRAPWIGVLLGIAAVGVGLAGNIILNPTYFAVFLQYFIPTVLIVSIMLGRVGLLRALLFVVRAVLSYFDGKMGKVLAAIRLKITQIAAQQVVFFTRGDNLALLNNAMLYVRRNEHTNRIKVVTVVADPSEVPERLPAEIRFLDEAYPEIDIELVVWTGTFTPELIDELSREWDIPKNFMFIGSPTGHLMYGLAELGGVRVVI